MFNYASDLHSPFLVSLPLSLFVFTINIQWMKQPIQSSVKHNLSSFTYTYIYIIIYNFVVFFMWNLCLEITNSIFVLLLNLVKKCTCISSNDILVVLLVYFYFYTDCVCLGDVDVGIAGKGCLHNITLATVFYSYICCTLIMFMHLLYCTGLTALTLGLLLMSKPCIKTAFKFKFKWNMWWASSWMTWAVDKDNLDQLSFLYWSLFYIK